ncbi:MAG: DNA replication/repair protein RecF [Aeriscardovia sp.]|nr:DNA replication/repair protein RecF [Aeriscardovia sp.]
MKIERLALRDYRNWEGLLLDPSPGVNVIYGPNGSGKTNIAEAVGLLASGSSARARLSLQVRHGASEADVKARIAQENLPDRIIEAAIKAGRLYAREDGGPWRSFSKVRPLAAVSFEPHDLLLCSSPDRRRSLLDEACSQMFPPYREEKRGFSRVLAQKSSLLKKIREEGSSFGPQVLSALEAYNFQFAQTSAAITKYRSEAALQIASAFSHAYAAFSGLSASLAYVPSLPEALQEGGAEKVARHLQERASAEIASGFPLLGPQRDDFSLSLEGFPLAEVASGGQSWMAALSLRMAQFRILAPLGPVLVLDDVFAQLDPEKRSRILCFLPEGTQVFITSTSREDVPTEEGWHGISIESLR